MKYLGYTEEALKAADAYWTAKEIEQQPSSWRRAQEYLVENAGRIKEFLDPVLARKDCRIILTGAGTSAFVGACLAPALSEHFGRPFEAIPTTDIVSSPLQYFQRDVPTLLVSFARSGNSPESVAVVDLAESLLDECFQLVFSCNPEGSLYRRSVDNPSSLALLMPEETNDRAFAMTSSFSSMLLSAVSVFTGIEAFSRRVESLSTVVEILISGRNGEIKQVAALGCSRVVYLGSNSLKGLAQEACLKLLELTDGHVLTMYDSPLGFRHGPKSILNDDSLVVVFKSGDKYTARYDQDIVDELVADRQVKKVLVLGPAGESESRGSADFPVAGIGDFSDLELLFPYIVFAQVYGFHHALQVGNRPDNPSASGTVNRVVKGVSIHPYPA